MRGADLPEKLSGWEESAGLLEGVRMKDKEIPGALWPAVTTGKSF